MNIRILDGLANSKGIVGTPIIYNNQLPIRIGLVENRRNGFLEKSGSIVGRNNNRNQWLIQIDFILGDVMFKCVAQTFYYRGFGFILDKLFKFI